MLKIYFFFFNDTATTEIYTLSLHDALPICHGADGPRPRDRQARRGVGGSDAPDALEHRGHTERRRVHAGRDRKSTRLNSSHANISYAVFCLKKKKNR